MTWDYAQTEYKKQKRATPEWHLERLITHGLRGEKLKREILKKYLNKLNIPENRRIFLEAILWDKKF